MDDHGFEPYRAAAANGRPRFRAALAHRGGNETRSRKWTTTVSSRTARQPQMDAPFEPRLRLAVKTRRAANGRPLFRAALAHRGRLDAPFEAPATTEIYTRPLPDTLPIWFRAAPRGSRKWTH